MAGVAMFVDLENLRYGLLKSCGQEPNFIALVEKAKKYGRPSTMRAYADFTEHPPEVTRALSVAGIEAINIPVKRTTYFQGGKAIERVKNAADMVLALDAVVEALAAESQQISKVFLIVTGDRDYIRLVTMLRNRFGHRVVIVGVPGSVAGDLMAAAGETDLVDVALPPPTDKFELKRRIVAMAKARPARMQFWTLKIIDQWMQDIRQAMPGIAQERRDALTELVKEGVFVQRERVYKNGPVMEAVLVEDRARELGYLL